MRELEKNSPVPVRKEMSMTEYAKLVDTNANLVDKIKEQQETIKGMQENQDSAIKIMKMYEDYKLKVDKAIEYIEENKRKGYRIPMSEDYDFWNELNENEIKTLLEILKGDDK